MLSMTRTNATHSSWDEGALQDVMQSATLADR